MKLKAYVAVAVALINTACTSTSTEITQSDIVSHSQARSQTLFITQQNKVITLFENNKINNDESLGLMLQDLNYERDEQGLLVVSSVIKNTSDTAIQIDAKTEFQHKSVTQQLDTSTWQRIYVPAQQTVTYSESSLYHSAQNFTLVIRESS